MAPSIRGCANVEQRQKCCTLTPTQASFVTLPDPDWYYISDVSGNVVFEETRILTVHGSSSHIEDCYFSPLHGCTPVLEDEEGSYIEFEHCTNIIPVHCPRSTHHGAVMCFPEEVRTAIFGANLRDTTFTCHAPLQLLL